MNKNKGIIKDFAGFTNRELTPKSIRTQDITTKKLSVTDNAEIQNLDVDSINASQFNLNGQFNSTSTSVFDFNGLIKINQAEYILTALQLEQALADAAISGGKSLILAPGIFFISETLIIPANTDLIGSGPNSTIIKTRDGFASSPSSAMYIAGGNNVIQNLQIDGNNGRSRLIDITNCSNVGIQNLELKKTSGGFINIRNSANNVFINNILFKEKQYSTEGVINISGSNSIIISNYRIIDINFTALNSIPRVLIESVQSSIIIISDYNLEDSVINSTCEKIRIINGVFNNIIINRPIFSLYGSDNGSGINDISIINTFIQDSIFTNSIFAVSDSQIPYISNKNQYILINELNIYNCTSVQANLFSGFIAFYRYQYIDINGFKINNSQINFGIYFFSNSFINCNRCILNGQNLNVGLNIFQVNNLLISNSTLSNYSNAIQIDESNFCNIYNCNILLPQTDSVKIDNSFNIIISNCNFKNPLNNNLDVDSSYNIIISDCILDANTVISDEYNSTSNVVYDTVIYSNTNISGSINNLKINNSNFSLIPNGGFPIINLSNGTNLKINNSFFERNFALELSSFAGIIGLSNYTDSQIENNYFKFGRFYSGISLTSSNNIIITNNQHFYQDFELGIIDSYNNVSIIDINSTSSIKNNYFKSYHQSNITVSGYDNFIDCGIGIVDPIYLILPNITENSIGQKIKFKSVDSGNIYIIPDSPGNDLINLSSITSNILINVVSNFATFNWTGNKWNLIGGSSGIVIT